LFRVINLMVKLLMERKYSSAGRMERRNLASYILPKS
jgi:hypothetical protein